MSGRRRQGYDDPGWPLDDVALMAIPVLGHLIGLFRRKRQEKALISLRRIYARILMAPVLLLVVLLVLSRQDQTLDGHWVGAAVITAIGIGTVIVTESYRRRPLVTTSPETLVGSYRALFFFRYAVSNSAVVSGFVAFFIVEGQLWLYVLGMLFGCIGLIRLAPTNREIARLQQQINKKRRELSLGWALTLTPAELQALEEPRP